VSDRADDLGICHATVRQLHLDRVGIRNHMVIGHVM